MCRGLAEGARRCPCSSPSRRAAYRKAYRERTRAVGLTTAGVDVKEAAGGQAADSFSIAEQVDLARTLSFLVSSNLEPLYPPVGADGKPDYEEYERVHKLWSDKRMWALNGSSVYEALNENVIKLGQAIADRAEEYAGVTGQQVRDGLAARFAVLDQRVEDTKAEHHRLQAELAADYEGLIDEKVEASLAAGNAWAQNPDDPGLQAERMRCRQELDEARQLRSEDPRNEKIDATYEEYRRLCRVRALGYDAQAQSELRALADGYLRALGDVRDTGGQVQWHSKSAKKAVAAFDEVSSLFPSDWIEQSNDGRPPVVKINKSRAHYSHGHREVTKKRVQKSYRFSYETAEDMQEAMDRAATSPWEDVVETPDADWGTHEFKAETRRFEVHFDYSGAPVDPDRPPRGRGWELHSFTDHTGECRQVWRRPKFEMQTVEVEAVPEIRTNLAVQVMEGRSSTFAISAHEMVHRFEATNPDIPRMESWFLERRSVGEELSRINPGRREKKPEVGYRDNLVDHYMGRVYETDRHFEVMSCGVESLFGGHFGGLIGAHSDGKRYHEDEDMRAFVLGTMAVANRSDADTVVQVGKEKSELQPAD